MAGADPNFPHANASIGQFGLDIVTYRVWSPNAPDNAKDMMSYCGPQWISDYTYQALQTALRSSSQVLGAAAPQPGVLVRIELPEAGAPVIQPSYSLSNVVMDATATSDYVVRLLDHSGNALVSQPVVVLQTSAHTKYKLGTRGQFENANTMQDTPPPMVQSIQALIPRPVLPIARIQLVRAGVVVAERAWVELPLGQAAVIANLTPDADGILQWGMVGRPALVRLTTDGGQTWTTLGVDIASGDIQIDVATLPAGNRRFEVVLSDSTP